MSVLSVQNIEQWLNLTAIDDNFNYSLKLLILKSELPKKDGELGTLTRRMMYKCSTATSCI